MSETVKLPLPQTFAEWLSSPDGNAAGADIACGFVPEALSRAFDAGTRAALASAPAGEPIPEGWTLKRHEDGVIGVWKEDVGGYAANREDDTIASAILWELANDLLSTPAAPPAGAGWQPIETAPKDARDLWLFEAGCEPEQFVGYWCSEGGGFWQYREGLLADVVEFAEPTHWMPLPASPVNQKDFDD
jgi:hypothetical protein